MKLTVGGSFHEPGWSYVCDTVKKLKLAGHTILAPSEEWEPINIKDEFVKFKGEEKTSSSELQKNFFSCIEQSDAYIISNPNSYEGFMVSIEFGYATACITSDKSPLKRIYFTNTPLGYDKFQISPNLDFETFLKNLYTNPEYKNELSFFKKHKSPKGVLEFTSEKDFFHDLKNMYGKLLYLQSHNGLVIGIESLINKDKKISQDDSEPEL